MATDRVVGIWPLAGFDKVLHYRLPPHIPEASVGALVRMPLVNRQLLGVVCAVDPVPDVPMERLKFVSHLVSPVPVMTPDLIRLAEWMMAYYGAPRESVIETIVPSAVRAGHGEKIQKYLSVAEEKPDANDLEHLQRRAPKQYALYRFLEQQFQPQPKGLVLARLKTTAAVCHSLVDKGWIREEERVMSRVAYEDDFGIGETVAGQRIELNEEQRVAAESIRAGLGSNEFGCHLLCGVTGSGKTEVYLDLLERTLKAGGGAIFLVPEVALTPQTVGRLRARLEADCGVRTVVWHSHLSDGERRDGWLSVARGEARVVVGARSAVFAPVPNLRLIIVDEEHEPAYKQDETPRYHGRDVAVYRAMLNNATCVLGSATPSLESYLNARKGKYQLARLTRRVDDRHLPYIHVVDMRLEMLKRRGMVTLCTTLAEKMRQRFEDRQQTILFINRRGYSSSMICQECGHVEECEHCSIAMTYHRSDETLKCHLCGAERSAPLRCPNKECRSPKIRWRGLGTQRVEEVVSRLLPTARVVRIDADVMSRKNRFRQILGEFRLGKIDVLIGTQMIGKGLDFPNVTLVGLVDADLSLHLPDFRANERTFQLLVQVAGRAGRGDIAGEVVLQTFTPQAMPIQYSRHADLDGFLEEESQIREAHRYPPYRHLIQQVFRGPNEEKVAFYATHWAKRVGEALGDSVELLGPAPCSVEKVKDHYRYQLWMFTSSVTRVVARLAELNADFSWPDDVIQVLDVDPVSLM